MDCENCNPACPDCKIGQRILVLEHNKVYPQMEGEANKEMLELEVFKRNIGDGLYSSAPKEEHWENFARSLAQRLEEAQKLLRKLKSLVDGGPFDLTDSPKSFIETVRRLVNGS